MPSVTNDFFTRVPELKKNISAACVVYRGNDTDIIKQYDTMQIAIRKIIAQMNKLKDKIDYRNN